MARTSFDGPVSGGYIVHTVTVGEQAASVTPEYHWSVPFPCRVVHISAKADTIANTPEYSVWTPTGDIIADKVLPTTLEEFYPGGANDLDAVASANRSLAALEDLVVLFTTVAAETIVGGCVVITLRVTGQPTAWDETVD